MEEINIATLKANLSAILSKVRKGSQYQVLDRKTPIALLTPLEKEAEPLVIKHGASRIKIPKGVANKIAIDAVKLLREDRDRR